VQTSQNHGYARLGRPCATGTGISSGSCAASFGSQSSLLLAASAPSLPPRESHRPLVAEAEDRVDRPRRLDPAEPQVGPLGKLLGEQPPDERLVDLELIGVHPRHRPNRRPRSARTWKYTQHYADAKTMVVEEILERASTPPAPSAR